MSARSFKIHHVNEIEDEAEEYVPEDENWSAMLQET
jgi:hypothetical protein